MIIKNIEPFKGEHCESSAVGNLLKHIGVFLSEPMLFGIGEGLAFIYWDGKQMGYPFLGGRCKQDALTDNIVRNLNLKIEINETGSQKKAWDNAALKIDQGIPVGLKMDCYYLDYFAHKIHFAAHYATLYGYDRQYAYLIDTVQQGLLVKTSLSSLAAARNARGPMSSKNRTFTMVRDGALGDLKSAIVNSIYNNSMAYLNPPIQNISFKGIRKTARLITQWFDRPEMNAELIEQTGILMEQAGTGGALFRNLYRDFLGECDELYPELELNPGYEKFSKIAPLWTEVAQLICSAGQQESKKELNKASQILMEIASLEEQTMKSLWQLTSVILNK